MKSSAETFSTRSRSRPLKAFLLFGPTGVGKTELLGRFGDRVEVINADSMQVYRGLDVGTAKPSAELLNKVPHHLINICEPDEQFHVGRFVEEANTLIPEIIERGRLPVVAGGTAFYFRNLMYGLPGTPEPSPETRARMQGRLDSEGLEALYRELQRVDPESALTIKPRDRYRVLRALEVYEETGEPRSAFQVPAEPRGDLEYRAVGLYREREHLYERINRRVVDMFDQGLLEEVADLVAAGYGPETPAMRAIGYREFFEHVTRRDLAAGQIDAETREVVIREIQRNSRRYAKRQITFFSRLPNVLWLEPGEEDEVRRLAEGLF